MSSASCTTQAKNPRSVKIVWRHLQWWAKFCKFKPLYIVLSSALIWPHWLTSCKCEVTCIKLYSKSQVRTSGVTNRGEKTQCMTCCAWILEWCLLHVLLLENVIFLDQNHGFLIGSSIRELLTGSRWWVQKLLWWACCVAILYRWSVDTFSVYFHRLLLCHVLHP